LQETSPAAQPSGAIAGAVVVLAQRSITDWITALLALVTVAILWRFKKVQEPVIVAAAP
jgi:chromate transporter